MGNSLAQSKQYIEDNYKGWAEEKQAIAARMRMVHKDDYAEALESERADLQEHLNHLNSDLDVVRDSIADMEHDKKADPQEKRMMYHLLENGERMYNEISKFLDMYLKREHIQVIEQEREEERGQMREQAKEREMEREEEREEMEGRRRARKSAHKSRKSRRARKSAHKSRKARKARKARKSAHKSRKARKARK